jgi:hypothetical protein
MKPDLLFNESKTVNEALSSALVHLAKLMAHTSGQDALDALAVVRAETYVAAREAVLSEEHLKQLDWIFDKAVFEAHAAFTHVPRQ